MKKSALLSVAIFCSLGMSAQSPMDAYTLSQSDLRGTARFMSMAGAFTALGGDLSTLTQNPGGIGIYRSQEVGLSVYINAVGTSAPDLNSGKNSLTRFDLSNVGYVGTFNLGGTMQTISWGFSYNRQKSFARNYSGSGMGMPTSVTNYIAMCAFGNAPDQLGLNISNDYNPYFDSDLPWINILAYNAGAINPIVNRNLDTGMLELTSEYEGLYQYGTTLQDGTRVPRTSGRAEFNIAERGYVDEYSFNIGGNVANVVYWGLGLGINDIKFEQTSTYKESMQNAVVPRSASDATMGTTLGAANYNLFNSSRISGTGFNVKLGVIVKPINELRIGFAVHTPTWYSLQTQYYATNDLSTRINNNAGQPTLPGTAGNDYTEDAVYDWNLKAPWRMMVGVAGVLGGRAILSLDYEMKAYQSMTVSDGQGRAYTDYNSMISTDYKPESTIRIGAEYRLTPQFSARLGYAHTTSAIDQKVANNDLEVITTGCNPSYSTFADTNYITAGLGFRTGGFYADLAYVYRHNTSTYHAFTAFEDYDGYWTEAPTAKINTNSNQVVISLGYKF